MKTLLLILITFLFIISCSPDKTQKTEITEKTEQNPVQNDFDFLLGNWERTNDQEGKKTFEKWEKQNDTMYKGHSFTMQKNDTVWQEFVTLSPIDGIWFYQVSMPDSNQSTDFKLTEKTNNAFSCENPENEFPKVINYSMKENNLYAEISAKENKVSFEFKKFN